MRSAALFLLFTSSVAHAQSVLVVHAMSERPFAEDIVQRLTMSGAFTSVEEFDSLAGTPDIAELLGYDVVLVTGDLHPADGIALGDTLADYVDAGGGVLEAGISVHSGDRYVGGRWYSGAYRPLDGDNEAYVTAERPSHVSWHSPVIWEGYNFIYTGPRGDLVVRPEADEILHWASSFAPAMASSSPTGAGVVVAFDALPMSTDVSAWGWDPAVSDAVPLLTHALEYAASGSTDRLHAHATGTCPGGMEVFVEDVAPRGVFVIYTTDRPGSTRLRVGPCSGTSVPGGRVQARVIADADSAGAFWTHIYPTAPVCGIHWYVVDMTTCAVSNVSTL